VTRLSYCLGCQAAGFAASAVLHVALAMALWWSVEATGVDGGAGERAVGVTIAMFAGADDDGAAEAVTSATDPTADETAPVPAARDRTEAEPDRTEPNAEDSTDPQQVSAEETVSEPGTETAGPDSNATPVPNRHGATMSAPQRDSAADEPESAKDQRATAPMPPATGEQTAASATKFDVDAPTAPRRATQPAPRPARAEQPQVARNDDPKSANDSKDRVQLSEARSSAPPSPAPRPRDDDRRATPAKNAVQPPALSRPATEAKPKPSAKPRPAAASARQPAKQPTSAAPSSRASRQPAGQARGSGPAKGAASESGSGGRSSASSKPGDSAAARAAEARYLRELQRAIAKRRYYPRSAQRRGVEGIARVQLTIQADGRFSAIRISGGSGSDDLDRAAVTTIERLGRFKPIPTVLGRNRWTLRVPIDYRLR